MLQKSVADLKADVFTRVFEFVELPSASLASAAERPLWIDPQALYGENEARKKGAAKRRTIPAVALGVGVPPADKRTSQKFRLSVLVQDRNARYSPFVERIVKAAYGEADVRFVGRVMAHAGAHGNVWHQQPCRPLKIGCSIGHYRTTAGTLGTFVKLRRSGDICLLSNNHVLALCNHAHRGDAILQPGRYDGGTQTGSAVGSLHDFIPISFAGGAVNFVDCALAKVSVPWDCLTLEGVGALAGARDEIASPAAPVRKVGRTTGATSGRVASIEVDNIRVAYRNGRQVVGAARFDGQMLVEGEGDGAFSKPGDSGAIVVSDTLSPVGLLFAGSDEGGRNKRGLTVVNPIGDVLDALDAELALTN